MLGVNTSYIIDHKAAWLLVGTDKGNLCLWDLRFRTLVNSWKLNTNNKSDNPSAIKKLILMPNDFNLDVKLENTSYFAMIGGTNESDISLWEIPSFECREAFSSSTINPKVKLFSLDEIEVTKEPEIDAILSDLNIDFDADNNKDKSMTALLSFRSNTRDYFACATWDRRVILWNIFDTAESISINNMHATTFNKSKVNLILQLNYERVSLDKSPARLDDLTTLNNIASQQFDSVRMHQDVITDVGVVTRPFEMIVSADRNGFINLYK